MRFWACFTVLPPSSPHASLAGPGGGGAVVDVPQRGRLGLVGIAPRQVAEEGALGHAAAAVVDGRVGVVPVDRQAQVAEEGLEGLLVLGGEAMAQLDEAQARDRDGLF